MWLFLKDKGPGVGAAELDAPVFAPYANQIAQMAKIRHRLRWFNAVTVNASPEELALIRALPFVSAIAPVVGLWRQQPAPKSFFSIKPSGLAAHIDYGASASQNISVGAVELHEAGYTGKGVKIAIFDAGFQSLNHSAFDSLSIIATWDFVKGSPTLALNSHGSEVLSVAGGYLPGKIIGPAYDAMFMLARTEDAFVEEPSEEDNYIAALEWADSLGADIVVTSIGYNTWIGSWPGREYTVEDTDGLTARITVAADLAVSRGITVITAIGNERLGGVPSWKGKMLFPADGFRVIGIGAAGGFNAPYTVASFSSLGLTSDGRIKPDVSAPGVGLMTIDVGTISGIRSRNGTSFSTPLVAGLVAQIKEARPEWGPADMMRALKFSGSQADSPDTLLGWGVVNGPLAVEAHRGVFGMIEGFWSFPGEGSVRLTNSTMDTTVATGPTGWFLITGLPDEEHTLTASRPGFIDGTKTFISGNKPTELSFLLDPDPNTIRQNVPSRLRASLSVWPNPANPRTRFPFNVPGSSGPVSVVIYDLLGRVVKSWHFSEGSSGTFEWNGSDNTGKSVASGLYLARLKSGGSTASTTVSLIR